MPTPSYAQVPTSPELPPSPMPPGGMPGEPGPDLPPAPMDDPAQPGDLPMNDPPADEPVRMA